MSDTLTLSAETRDRVGKGASRALRREGRVPAVIYGNNQEPTSIHLDERALYKALHTGHFMNSVVMIEGLGGKAIRTLPKDVSLDVVTERPVHVDFLRISEHATVTVAVPVVFTDEEDAPGLKAGGVLNIVAHELQLTVDAAEIPSEISVSLKGLDAGATIHLSDITLPKGASAAVDADTTIATIAAPTAVAIEAEDAAAEAEAAEAGEATDGDAAEGEATDGE